MLVHAHGHGHVGDAGLQCGRRLLDRRGAGGETAETFKPYGVGLVQLDDEVRVEGRLTESDPARLRIGMEVELVIVPFRVDPDGTEVLTFAFAPIDEQEG